MRGSRRRIVLVLVATARSLPSGDQAVEETCVRGLVSRFLLRNERTYSAGRKRHSQQHRPLPHVPQPQRRLSMIVRHREQQVLRRRMMLNVANPIHPRICTAQSYQLLPPSDQTKGLTDHRHVYLAPVLLQPSLRNPIAPNPRMLASHKHPRRIKRVQLIIHNRRTRHDRMNRSRQTSCVRNTMHAKSSASACEGEEHEEMVRLPSANQRSAKEVDWTRTHFEHLHVCSHRRAEAVDVVVVGLERRLAHEELARPFRVK